MIPVPLAILKQFAALYGTESTHLVHFGGGRDDSDGVLYAYPYQDRRRLLKIMALSAENPRLALLHLEERLRFMEFLGEKGAPVVFPQLSPQGNLYESLLDVSHTWVGYCMELVPGRSMRFNTWKPDFFRRWGRLIGRLHRLAQEYPSWQSCLDPQTGAEFLTWREEWQGFYQWCPDEEVKQKWAEIGQRLESFPIARNVYGFIHNDPHLMNLLIQGRRLTLLDFDVANHHWFINDIAIACQSTLFAMTGGMERPLQDRAKLLEFLALFMAGYRQENDLPAEWLDHLDTFIAYRRILLFTVMHGWIQSQPAQYASWKKMILTQPELAGALAAALQST